MQTFHADIVRIDGSGGDWKSLKAGLTGKVGNRRAVQIAACCRVKGVEVGMGVQPQNELRLAQFLCPARHTGDRSSGHGMVATKENRQIARTGHLVGPAGHAFSPRYDRIQIAHSGIGMTDGRRLRGCRITHISHLPSKVLQDFRQTRDAKGRGPMMHPRSDVPLCVGMPRIWHALILFPFSVRGLLSAKCERDKPVSVTPFRTSGLTHEMADELVKSFVHTTLEQGLRCSVCTDRPLFQKNNPA